MPTTAATDDDETGAGTRSAPGPAPAQGPPGPDASATTPPTTPEPRGRGELRSKGEQTRQLILDTALRLFRERGYAETTMRAIAKEAGVAVGNAYYYFDSKEHLIQGFYDRTQVAHGEAVEPLLAAERDFAGRLRGVLHAGIDVNAPYHAFAATFFKSAAEPSSPLSPFSEQSSPARAAAVEIFHRVVDGSSVKVDPELRRELPELLWLGWMGIILFWVHDASPEQRRTRRLIDGVVPLVDRMVQLSRLRVLRPALRQVLAVVAIVRSP